MARKSSVPASRLEPSLVGPGSNVVINNSGEAKGIGPYGVGHLHRGRWGGGTNQITNSGTVFGDFAGILAVSFTGTKIVNSGDISAGSSVRHRRLRRERGDPERGRITGFVELTDSADTFVNQSGGTFEARLTSDFGGGSDVFVNESGGTVHTAADGGQIEHVAFVNLESFENQGLISLQDGQAGDLFEISNTVGQRNLAFTASGNSTLAVDTFLGGPGSISDTFTINGNVSGQTLLTVHDTNPGPGAFNEKGIPVVYANGNVNSNAFFLKKPIDAGLFEYDLFFKPTGSGIFELKSLPGGGSHVLPHLLTNIEDVFPRRHRNVVRPDRRSPRVVARRRRSLPTADWRGRDCAGCLHHSGGVGARLGKLDRARRHRDHETVWPHL